MESLGEYGKPFELYCNADNEEAKINAIRKIAEFAESPLWQSETRGTAFHYRSFFPDDEHITDWSLIMKKNNYNKV